MKDLITSIASVMIIMMFLMQFAANQVSYTKVAGAENLIRSFGAAAEKSGRVEEENLLLLRRNLAERMDCSEGEVSIVLRNTEHGADYVIEVPVSNVIGPAKMLGISSEDNKRLHISDGSLIFSGDDEDADDAEKAPEEGETP